MLEPLGYYMIRHFPAFLAVLTLTFSTAVSAWENDGTLVFDIGMSSSNAQRGYSEFDVYRIGRQWNFKHTLWQGESASLGGYYEGSLNYWRADQDTIFAIAFSPVFVLMFGNNDGGYRPFIEVGVGLALLSDDLVAGRRMGSYWQFEDRIGFGFRSDRMGFHYRYMHYSNGGLSKPNQGIDAHVIGMIYSF